MEKRLLLRTQKNQILEKIVKLKIDPLDFNFIEIESGLVRNCKVSKLVHKPTGYYFTFDFTRGNVNEHWIEYFPNLDGKKRLYSSTNYSNVGGELTVWLAVIKTEIDAPDLWTTILDENKIFELALTPDLGDDLFTQAEQKYISEQLKLTEQRIIKTHELKPDEIRLLEKQINYLNDSIKRLGRYTWIHTAIGVSFTIMLGLRSDVSKVISKELLSFLGMVISQVLQGELHYLP